MNEADYFTCHLKIQTNNSYPLDGDLINWALLSTFFIVLVESFTGKSRYQRFGANPM